MKLLREIYSPECALIVEGEGAGKKHFIEGVFMQSAIKNRNGRIYEERILDKEVARYIKEAVDTSRSLGELGHPENPQINLDRVSHKIVSLRKEGTNWIGKAQILETPMGNIVRGLMDGGVKIGVSSRGLGSLVERDGAKYVGEDFRLVTPADIVSDPSAPDAFVTNLMENKEWIWDPSGHLIEREVEIKKSINTLSKNGQLTEEALVRIFKKILTQI